MSRQSAIPHLARAIYERRSLQTWHNEAQKRFASRAAARIPPSKKPQIPRTTPTSMHGATPPRSGKNWPAQIVNVEDAKDARKVSVMFKVTSVFALLMGFYCTYLYKSWTDAVKGHAMSDDHLPFNADVSSRWKQLGRDFDDEVELSEKLMWMRKKRKRLAKQAYGNVLEVSVGTGRNLEYYDLRPFDPTNASRRNIITHLTLNDQSAVIIAAAEQKLEAIIDRQEESSPTPVDFVVGDAGVPGLVDRPPGGYDTIVQTMGVCSMVDPVGFLRRMGQLCRQPGEKSSTPERWRAKDDDGKGGQILLLEHGRGYFGWLNWILDTGASLHAHEFGCWWNKDIEQIVRQSGLEVEVIKRYHGGTTWMIVLRPKAQESKAPGAQFGNVQVVPTRSSHILGQK